MRIAGEIGVSEASVHTAIALVERDQLMRPEEARTSIDRWFGARTCVCVRKVPGPVSEVRRIIGQVFSDQLFKVSRNMGDRVIWECSESFLDGIRRTFDFDKRYRLTEVQVIDATVKDAALAGCVDVRIELDLSDLRKSRLRKGVLLPLMIGGGLTAIGGAIGFAAIAGWIFAGGGMATGAGIHMRMRNGYQESVTDARTAVERLLDHLEHERG